MANLLTNVHAMITMDPNYNPTKRFKMQLFSQIETQFSKLVKIKLLNLNTQQLKKIVEKYNKV